MQLDLLRTENLKKIPKHMSTISSSTLTSESVYQDIDRVYEKQVNMLQALKNASVKDRIKKIKKIKSFLQQEEHLRKLEAAFFADFKKPATEVQLTEVLPLLGHISEITKNLARWNRPQPLEVGLSFTGLNAKVVYEPKGQVLIIAPWNYPFLLAMYPLLYAIAAGCSVLLKPSELTPATSQFMDDMLQQLFPDESVKAVQGAIPETTHLLDKKWGHIFFTGSPMVGKIVMKAASKHLASVSLELGGKSPCVVDDSARLKAVAKRIVWGKFVNAGQTCLAPDYLIVQEDLKADLLRLLKQEINTFYGASAQKSESLARIISDKHYQRLCAMIEDAQEKGGQIVEGGVFDDSDRYIAPTIIDRAVSTMQLMQEEIFGPILPVMTFQKIEDVPDIINQMDKPLSMYICSSKNAHIDYLIAHSSAGGTVVNDFLMGAAIPSVPFGGVNNSGIGKAYGKHGFIEFSNERAVIRRSFGHIHFLYPPYTKRVGRIIQLLKRII